MKDMRKWKPLNKMRRDGRLYAVLDPVNMQGELVYWDDDMGCWLTMSGGLESYNSGELSYAFDICRELPDPSRSV